MPIKLISFVHSRVNIFYFKSFPFSFFTLFFVSTQVGMSVPIMHGLLLEYFLILIFVSHSCRIIIGNEGTTQSFSRIQIFVSESTPRNFFNIHNRTNILVALSTSTSTSVSCFQKQLSSSTRLMTRNSYYVSEGIRLQRIKSAN